MKRQAPTPIRICELYKNRLKEQAEHKNISLHKHMVETLIKQAKKPLK